MEVTAEITRSYKYKAYVLEAYSKEFNWAYTKLYGSKKEIIEDRDCFDKEAKEWFNKNFPEESISIAYPES